MNEVSIHCFNAAGGSPPLWTQAAPVEVVVPRLGRVVEYLDLVGLAGGRGDDFFEREAGKLGAGDELVQRVDVPLMVLAVVESDRLRGHDGLERVFRIGKRRQDVHRAFFESGIDAHLNSFQVGRIDRRIVGAVEED